ncbi:MAG TPA: hypothetical protein IAC82_05335 [Candidatus Merdivicinus intestinigallinarum]|nr:hypothetical protein [Candidatus Merdivicinus intestinigallinarum]
MEKLKLYIISHTHWDREWYQSFQNYRYRLVRVIDDLIEGLEKDPEYKVFHMDGQTIVLEDYLEIRPENADRLAKLIRDGRILIGPWYVMPDEFLISGESLVKNLRMGHKICKDYGVSPMKNGYVTDIFGHNSQFPQILNGFDIHSATLYRGIGDYEKDAFRWRSPDGSEVIAAKLEAERSYSNFYFAVRWPYEERGFDPEDAVKRMQVLVDRARKMAATDMVLMMDGVDHCGMEHHLPEMLRLFAEKIPDIEIVHTKLEDYFARIKEETLDVIEGSLYNVAKEGLNNQVLKNVLSSMVHVKQANDRCETQLTAVTEPLNAYCEMLGDDLKAYREDDYSLSPRRTYLDKAWKTLIQNHPHDSICGCSLSDVHRDNIYRYRQAQQMAEIAAQDCINVLTRNIRCNGEHQEAVLLYNPSQKPVKGVHVFELPVAAHPNPNRRFYDANNNPLEVQILDQREETFANERLRQLIRFDPMSVLKVAAHVEIPALGYTVIYCDNLQSEFHPERKAYGHDVYYPPLRLSGSQMVSHGRLDNGALVVELNSRGLLDVTVKSTGKTYRNLHLLEDRSDAGEGWNWRPVRYDSAVYGDNALEQFQVTADGPFCTVWKLTYNVKLPHGLAADGMHRGEGEKFQRVTTWLTIPKDSVQLTFRTVVENETENHRLRVLFPTELKTDCFYTRTPFDMTKWPVAHPDNRHHAELETKVHPSQGVTWITDGKDSAAMYAKGLYEVEVTDNEERAMALTLFRAAQHETGTCHPEDIKMLRKMEFEYALDFGTAEQAAALAEGEAYRAGVRGYRFEQNPAAGPLGPTGQMLEISGDQIVSAIFEDSGRTYVRLYDVSGKDGKSVLTFPRKVKGAQYVNLNLEPQSDAAFDKNSVTLSCPAHKIVTVAVELE